MKVNQKDVDFIVFIALIILFIKFLLEIFGYDLGGLSDLLDYISLILLLFEMWSIKYEFEKFRDEKFYKYYISRVNKFLIVLTIVVVGLSLFKGLITDEKFQEGCSIVTLLLTLPKNMYIEKFSKLVKSNMR